MHAYGEHENAWNSSCMKHMNATRHTTCAIHVNACKACVMIHVWWYLSHAPLMASTPRHRGILCHQSQDGLKDVALAFSTFFLLLIYSAGPDFDRVSSSPEKEGSPRIPWPRSLGWEGFLRHGLAVCSFLSLSARCLRLHLHIER